MIIRRGLQVSLNLPVANFEHALPVAVAHVARCAQIVKPGLTQFGGLRRSSPRRRERRTRRCRPTWPTRRIPWDFWIPAAGRDLALGLASQGINGAAHSVVRSLRMMRRHEEQFIPVGVAEPEHRRLGLRLLDGADANLDG